MARPNKPLPPISEISPLDHRILLSGNTSTNIELLPSKMELAKSERQANTLKQNLELVREVGRLRKEVAFYKSREKSLLGLFQTCVEAQDMLKGATKSASDDIATHEERFLRNLGVTIDDSEENDFNVI